MYLGGWIKISRMFYPPLTLSRVGICREHEHIAVGLCLGTYVYPWVSEDIVNLEPLVWVSLQETTNQVLGYSQSSQTCSSHTANVIATVVVHTTVTIVEKVIAGGRKDYYAQFTTMETQSS